MTQTTTKLPSTAHATRAVVACQQVTKVFRDFWMRPRARAVDRLSFEIQPREIFGLLGPNGSGKSTTIKMLLGLLRPTSGRVAVFGRPPTDVSIKKRIGYLPEESYLYPFLNARETLEYYAKLFEIDYRTRQKRIDELLDMVGLSGAQYRPVRDYSKGMQRRIGLAQALINDPDLLILDEPTTGLDPIGTRQVKQLIIELGRRGKTVLLSSHLLADVEDCVDRMVILYGGKKREEGTCDGLLTRHAITTIETEHLDDDTIAEIDRLVRSRSGGTKSVLRVSAPRQKLEELFLGIVERAQQERLATSGATHAGQTASFLRDEGGEDRDAGRALIENLTRAEPTPEIERAPLPRAETRPREDLIETLTRGPEGPDGSPEADSRASARPAPAADDVDRGVIDALLSGKRGDAGRSGGSAREDVARTSGSGPTGDPGVESGGGSGGGESRR